MMKKAKVIGISTSSNKGINGFRGIVLTCKDDKGKTFLATTTETLCPKLGDLVWILQDEKNLNYYGYSAVAVLIA